MVLIIYYNGVVFPRQDQVNHCVDMVLEDQFQNIVCHGNDSHDKSLEP